MFITLAFAIRIIEALGNAAFLTASFAIIAKEFPNNVGTTFVSLSRTDIAKKSSCKSAYLTSYIGIARDLLRFGPHRWANGRWCSVRCWRILPSVRRSRLVPVRHSSADFLHSAQTSARSGQRTRQSVHVECAAHSGRVGLCHRNMRNEFVDWIFGSDAGASFATVWTKRSINR